MGCGCGLLTPYEECAFLLKDFNKLVIERKNLMVRKMIDEKKKTDKKALAYRVKLYKTLETINNRQLTPIETKKLKQLNDLFLVLLTEESNMKKNEISNNIEENANNNDEILIMNSNKIKGRYKKENEIKKNRTFISLIPNHTENL